MNTYMQEMIKRVTEQSKLDDVKYAKEDEAKANLEAQQEMITELKQDQMKKTAVIFREVKGTNQL